MSKMPIHFSNTPTTPPTSTPQSSSNADPRPARDTYTNNKARYPSLGLTSDLTSTAKAPWLLTHGLLARTSQRAAKAKPSIAISRQLDVRSKTIIGYRYTQADPDFSLTRREITPGAEHACQP